MLTPLGAGAAQTSPSRSASSRSPAAAWSSTGSASRPSGGPPGCSPRRCCSPACRSSPTACAPTSTCPTCCACSRALLVESRRRRAGAPVLVLLAIAGLLRPEAWAFSGLYWLYLLPVALARASWRAWRCSRPAPPLLWLASDLLVTGNPLWSLTHTRDDASALERETGIAKVPQYIPRRIGEILGAPELAARGARRRAVAVVAARPRPPARRRRRGRGRGVRAVRHASGCRSTRATRFFAAAILCLFCGAGLFGWTRAGARRPPPSRLDGGQRGGGRRHRRLHPLPGARPARPAAQPLQPAGGRSTTSSRSCTAGRSAPAACRSGVPNHAPVPLLALELRHEPGERS